MLGPVCGFGYGSCHFERVGCLDSGVAPGSGAVPACEVVGGSGTDDLW